MGLESSPAIHPLVNPQAGDGHSSAVRNRWTNLLMLAVGCAHADISWNFAQDDLQPGGHGGVYAYVYPSDSTNRQTPSHTATLQRIPSGQAGAAKLSFVLDGRKYPSAGFGLMFPESRPLDLRGLQSIRLHISSDRARTVRLSLSSRLSAYQIAADTGASFGRDVKANATGQDVTISVANLTWPTWVTDPPAVTSRDVLGSTFAIQLNVSCTDSVCARDSGWIRLDSLRLVGVDLAWPAPSEGSCNGDSLGLSRFSQSSPKKNGLGGWWYAYTDQNAADTGSRGMSRILSASDTTDPTSWRPDSIQNNAYLKFHLQRVGAYSGFAAVETQFGAPDGLGNPVPASLPGLRGISFQLAFDSGFPAVLGGVTFHAKKAGKAFAEGQDHQVRIPFDSISRRWCLDFDSMRQPDWSAWGQYPFTPDSLLAMSWEVKLPGSTPESSSGFRISEIQLWSTDVSLRNASIPRWSLRRRGSRLELSRPLGSGALFAELLDVRGRILSSVRAGSDQTHVTLESNQHASSWIRVHDDLGWRTLSVPPSP
jgi:hypothetical protein